MATNTAGSVARTHSTQQISYLRKRITFATENTAITIGVIPANAIIVGGGVMVVTAFDDSGTDTLDIGFTGGSSTADPDAYATLLVVDAVGYIILDVLGATANIMQTVDTTVTCIYNGQNNNAAAGVAEVIIFYVQDNDQ